jgi:hypothetical protein
MSYSLSVSTSLSAPLRYQEDRNWNSLADTIAEIQIYMTCLGVTRDGVIFRSLCRASGFPESWSLFEEVQLVELHQVLESKWKTLPNEVKNQRVIVSGYLSLLGIDWEHESILKWIKKQQTPFTELTHEQLEKLSKSLEHLCKPGK